MTKRIAGLLCTVLLAGGPASTQTGSPRLNLEGDGHACSGYLKVDQARLRWKSSFSTCDSAYRVLAHGDGAWTMELVGKAGVAAHRCSIKVVEAQRQGPEVEYAMWEVTGYASAADVNKKPPVFVLDCPMQAAEPKH